MLHANSDTQLSIHNEQQWQNLDVLDSYMLALVIIWFTMGVAYLGMTAACMTADTGRLDAAEDVNQACRLQDLVDGLVGLAHWLLDPALASIAISGVTLPGLLGLVSTL